MPYNANLFYTKEITMLRKLLIFCMCGIFWASMAMAAVDVSLNAPEILSTDDLLSVELKATGTGNIAGAQMTIFFDPDFIYLKQVQGENGILTNSLEQANALGKISITYLNADGNGLDSSTTPILASFEFKPLQEGETQLSIENGALLSDIDLNDITGQLTHTSIQITLGEQKINTLWQGPFSAEPETTFRYILKTSGPELIAAATFRIHFDPYLLTLENITSIDDVTFGNIQDANANGNLLITWLDKSGNGVDPNTIEFATLSFKGHDRCTTELRVKNADISNTSFTDISGALIARSIKIGEANVNLGLTTPATVAPESQFDVHVRASGYGTIKKADVRINFDKDNIQIQTITPFNGFSASDIQESNTVGHINFTGNFTMDNAIDASTNPAIATITYQVVNGAGQAAISIDASSSVYDEQNFNIIGQKQDVVIAVKDFATLSGNILASIAGLENLNIPDATITIAGDDGNFTAQSDELGHFEFSGVPPGDYVLTIAARDLKPVHMEVSLDSGQSLQLNVPKLIPNNGDINNDGKIGIVEAIHALGISAGM